MVIVWSNCSDMKNNVSPFSEPNIFFSSADYNVLEKFWYVSSLVKKCLREMLF